MAARSHKPAPPVTRIIARKCSQARRNEPTACRCRFLTCADRRTDMPAAIRAFADRAQRCCRYTSGAQKSRHAHRSRHPRASGSAHRCANATFCNCGMCARKAARPSGQTRIAPREAAGRSRHVGMLFPKAAGSSWRFPRARALSRLVIMPQQTADCRWKCGSAVAALPPIRSRYQSTRRLARLHHRHMYRHTRADLDVP